jgi:hypothetical protein
VTDIFRTGLLAFLGETRRNSLNNYWKQKYLGQKINRKFKNTPDTLYYGLIVFEALANEQN